MSRVNDVPAEDNGELPFDSSSLIDCMDRWYPQPSVDARQLANEANRLELARLIGQREVVEALKLKRERAKQPKVPP